MKKFAFMIVLPTLLTFGLVLPDITNENPNLIPDIPSINEIEMDTAALENIKGELTDFYQVQINMFSNESLIIFDDDENPVKFDLELPDFNLLNVFSDLNKVVTIKLYTNESGDEYKILRINNEKTLEESYFDTNRHTYIITHGFMGSSDSPSCKLVRYALQNTTDSNIITVNWSPLAKGAYSVAKLFTSRVGEYIGQGSPKGSHWLQRLPVAAARLGQTGPHKFSSNLSFDSSLILHGFLETEEKNDRKTSWQPNTCRGSQHLLKVVSPDIGKLISFLYANGMNPETTTLIGHSLGAHMMGIAGQNVNRKVNHTIGLDPAWPLFVSVPENHRLSPDDALYVEVIHTNGGLLGYPSNLGHYDFYPNGGSSQKGCQEDLISACSHGRPFKYLAEQISNPGPDFCSLKCTSYSEFTKKQCTHEIATMGGINSYPASQGQYYLQTNSKEPFSLSTQCA